MNSHDHLELNNPWLISVWPGMGNVAVSAGYYLMAKLGMYQLSEFPARDLFEIEYVEVKKGLILSSNLPRSRFFAWKDPQEKNDLVVFLGEAQPPSGKNAFCHRLIQYAIEIGVKKVFTFAAMATEMHPSDESRVFGAATTVATLKVLESSGEIEVLEGGRIGGLNGVILDAAADAGLPGACLLGEMPHIFAQIPFPKASLRVLEIFSNIAAIKLDLRELETESHVINQQLEELLTILKKQFESDEEKEKPETFLEPNRFQNEVDTGEPRTDKNEYAQSIENLFDEVQNDRTKAYKLKRELDRLGLFKKYEDRFLDLFRNSGDRPE